MTGAPERRSPAARADRARKCDCLGAVTCEIIAARSDNQTLALSVGTAVAVDIAAHRATWLARRLRIAPEMAATIAPLVFGREAKR